MARRARYRRNEAAVMEKMEIAIAPAGRKKVKIPRKKGKPVTQEVIDRYIKILRFVQSKEQIGEGNSQETLNFKGRLAALEETYPGVKKAAEKGAKSTQRAGKRASYTPETSAEELSKLAKKAAKAARDLRKNKITITLPDGSTVEAGGYATVRAANIDAKQMVSTIRRVYQSKLGFPPGQFSVQTLFDGSAPVDTKGESTESGYRWGEDFGVSALGVRSNPRRLRHNTHLPVGTTVDYKGKTAKVTAQHDRDVYTVRFASTGKSMRVPGFLLVRR